MNKENLNFDSLTIRQLYIFSNQNYDVMITLYNFHEKRSFFFSPQMEQRKLLNTYFFHYSSQQNNIKNVNEQRKKNAKKK